jgi:hypothetical protein
MRIDLLGQIILMSTLILLLFLSVPAVWVLVLFSLLALWQAGSALELAVQYEYVARVPFVWLLPLVLVLLLALQPYLGVWVLIGAGAILMSYFILTARDWRVVSRRPRSFWDI